LNHRENWLRAVEYRGPEYIPAIVTLSPLVWHTHREKLDELVLRHPALWPGFVPGSVSYDDFPPTYREGEYFRDNWGCLWYNGLGGLEGMIVEHPLEDWSALATYQPPDFYTKHERGDRDWDEVTRRISAQKEQGILTWADTERLFDRMYFLRGFENLMMDMIDDDPHVPELIEMLMDYQLRCAEAWLKIGVDVMSFHTDIGTQTSLMISPEKFRQYIKPMFKKLFTTCREGGAHVYMSSDGCLLDIVDDLVECGVSVHDPQLRANTIDGIAKAYKGKMCANVDLDRQMFGFCAPQDLDAQVKEVVEKLDSPEGGLMVIGQVCDDVTPLENIEAICTALERYCLRL
jgi:hypothetical protein